jgi:hypothetical protein
LAHLSPPAALTDILPVIIIIVRVLIVRVLLHPTPSGIGAVIAIITSS